MLPAVKMFNVGKLGNNGKSGGGPPQSKTQSVCRCLTNCAKRPGVRQPSGALTGAGRSADIEGVQSKVELKL
jgi:hypothetical protein